MLHVDYCASTTARQLLWPAALHGDHRHRMAEARLYWALTVTMISNVPDVVHARSGWLDLVVRPWEKQHAKMENAEQNQLSGTRL